MDRYKDKNQLMTLEEASMRAKKLEEERKAAEEYHPTDHMRDALAYAIGQGLAAPQLSITPLPVRIEQLEEQNKLRDFQWDQIQSALKVFDERVRRIEAMLGLD